MNRINKQMRAMESRDHFINEASLKNQMIKRDIRRRVNFFIFFFMLSVAMVWGQEKRIYPLKDVIENGKRGWKDPKTGEMVIPAIYDYEANATYFYLMNDNIVVRKDGKWGIIDKEGKIISDFIYSDAWKWDIRYEFPDKYLPFCYVTVKSTNNGKWGVLDGTTGKFVIEPFSEIPIVFSKMESMYEKFRLHYKIPEDVMYVALVEGHIKADSPLEGWYIDQFGNKVGITESEYKAESNKRISQIEAKENEERINRIKAAKIGYRLVGIRHITRETKTGAFGLGSNGTDHQITKIIAEIVTWNEEKDRVYVRIISANHNGNAVTRFIREEQEYYISQNPHFWINPYNDGVWKWDAQ